MHGVLLVDKQAGITSHDVVDKIRKIAGTRRVGHTGTLDPGATGLLVVCIGSALKIVEFLGGFDKEYIATLKLGTSTNTHDKDGKVVFEGNYKKITREIFEKTVKEFKGEILQTPPLVSALKIKGKKLYEYARKGQKIDIPTRSVKFYSIDVLDFSPPYVKMKILCSKGAYIRALARDIGERLGCGAIIYDVRRTIVGSFSINNAIKIEDTTTREDIEKALIPIDKALSFLPELRISVNQAQKFVKGQFIFSTIPGELFRVYVQDRNTIVFIGIGRRDGPRVCPRKVII
jgi:tRNA pseudouridine55 synthase